VTDPGQLVREERARVRDANQLAAKRAGATIVEVTGLVVCCAILASTFAGCTYLAVTHPWAMLKLLASLFGFAVATCLFGLVFIKHIVKLLDKA